MTAEELVERYEGWLEAAEKGDFTDVEFTEYDGNTLPSPVMQLSVYEEDGELQLDEDVLRAYMIDTGDIGYRNLQKLAKGTGINPIGKETSDLLDDVRDHYGSTQEMLEEINEREEEFEDFKFETIVRERLLEEGIHGRDRIRENLDKFKDESNYDESENPEPQPEPDPGPEPEPVPNGGENNGGENLMTSIDEFRAYMRSAAQDVEDGVRSAEDAYEEAMDKYEDTVNDLEELGRDVEELLMAGSHDIGRINAALSDLEDAASEAESKANDLEARADNATSRLGY